MIDKSYLIYKYDLYEIIRLVTVTVGLPLYDSKLCWYMTVRVLIR